MALTSDFVHSMRVSFSRMCVSTAELFLLDLCLGPLRNSNCQCM